MVTDMGIGDVVEGVIEQWTERAIHCAQGTSQPVPFFASEVWHVHISVLQVGDEHQVIVYDEVRHQVIEKNSSKSQSGDGIDQKSKSGEESDVCLNDEPVILRLKESGGRREVVCILSSVLCRTSGVEDEVAWHPSDSQHDEDSPGLGDRSFSEHFLSPVGASGRSKDFVVLAGSSVSVMQSVSDSPGVIRNK